jgi:hypothetical protein
MYSSVSHITFDLWFIKRTVKNLTHEYEPVHEEILSGVPPGPEQRGESILMSTAGT